MPTSPRLLATDNRIILPISVPIRLITTSNDAIHTWASRPSGSSLTPSQAG